MTENLVDTTAAGVAAPGLLTITGLGAAYGNAVVLRDVNLSLERGQTYALLGRNGMGKSTLMKSIVGWEVATRGSVKLEGVELTGLPTYKRVPLGVAIVPQGRRVFPTLTVTENLQVTQHSVSRTGDWTVERILDLFPEISRRAASPAGTLSGGEQELLAIGRALLVQPQVLLLDEPTEGLAPQVIDRVADVVAGLRDGGLTTLLVEQNIRFATGLADRVGVLAHGGIVFEGSTAEFEANDEVRRTYVEV